MKARKLFARTLLAAALAVGLMPSAAFAQEVNASGPASAAGSGKTELSASSPEGMMLGSAVWNDGTATDQAIGEPEALDETADGEASDRTANGKLYVVGEELYDYAYQVLELVNQQRAANGLSALSMDRDLLEAAMARAAECSVYFSHTRPDGSQCFSISGKMYGENIAAGQRNPAAVMDSWMNSTGHRENILSSRWNSIGIGCFRAPDGMLYWTQAFGSASATPVSQPENGMVAWSVYIDSNLVPVSLDPILVDEGGNVQEPPVRLYVNQERDAMATAVSVGDGGWGSVSLVAGESFQWVSSNPKVLSVDSHGHVKALAAGTARLTGTSGVFRVSYDVTVGYSDAVPGDWYEEAVQFASQNGLIAGYGGTTLFGVGDPVTRAQLATILWRYAEPEAAAAYGNVAANETGMPDVAANEWWTAAANWAVDNGVINGVVHEDGTRTFDPDGYVTREQFALIVANFNGVDADSYGTGSLAKFPDPDSVDGWAAGGMAWAVDNGVINGVAQGDVRYLCGQEPVTREQTATILMNAIQRGVL